AGLGLAFRVLARAFVGRVLVALVDLAVRGRRAGRFGLVAAGQLGREVDFLFGVIVGRERDLLGQAVAASAACRSDVLEAAAFAGLASIGMLLRVVQLELIAVRVDEVVLALLQAADRRVALAFAIEDFIAGLELGTAELQRIRAHVGAGGIELRRCGL